MTPERVAWPPNLPKVPAKLLLKDWGRGVTQAGCQPGRSPRSSSFAMAGHVLPSHLLSAAAGGQQGRPHEEGDRREQLLHGSAA